MMSYHDLSVSEDSDDDNDGGYVPLLQRLAPSDECAGSSFQDPIRLESPERETLPNREDQLRSRSPHRSPPPAPLPTQNGVSRPAATTTSGRQRGGGRGAASRQKALEKELRRAETAARRKERPEHCQKSLHALVDRRVLEVPGGGQLLAALQENSDVTVHVITAAQPGTVTWEREVSDCLERDGQAVTTTRREPQDHLVAVIEAATLASLVQTGQQTVSGGRGLTETMLQLGRETGQKVTVLCWDLDKLCRTKKVTGSYGRAAAGGGGGRRLERLLLEDAVVDSLLETPHSLRIVTTPADGGVFLAQMTKAIAEEPFKRQRGRHPFAWFADADSARPVKVDASLRGLRRLWTEQLRHLCGGSLETAQAVGEAYPSPQALLQGFASCASVEQRERLVADLTVRRSVGPLVSSRRVGNETSRRLYAAMTATDGDLEL